MNKQIFDKIGFPGLPLVVRTDSTAPKWICNRKGVGKVKHLDLRELWVQDLAQKGQLRIEKEPTKTNWANLSTKRLTGSRITELLRMMRCTEGASQRHRWPDP